MATDEAVGGATRRDDATGRDTRKLVFVAFAILTVAGVVASTFVVEQPVPPRIYLFGFLGATVYVFTSLAEKFDEGDRYALEVASKGMAAFPLAAGVYLLAFAFPGTGGDGVPTGERVVSGLVFLSGAYVSLTLRALGSLAHRMLGVPRNDESDADSSSAGTQVESRDAE